MHKAILQRTLLPALLALGIPFSWLSGQDSKSQLGILAEITFRTADIRSKGTRMAAEVFAPKVPKEEKLPTIIMSHGWGGLVEHPKRLKQ